MDKYVIPACHHYITNHKNTVDYDLVVSVSLSAYRNCYGSEPEMKDVIFAYHSIRVSLKEELLKLTDITCYEVIDKFACSFMCTTCPYSRKYRNANEHDETTLISYALQSADHFNYIQRSGCRPDTFKSVLFIGKESTVPIIPLLSLIYEFLNNVADKIGFRDIHVKLTNALKETNKGKLNAKNYEFLENYIKNMYSTGEKFQQKDMIAPLKNLKLDIPAEKEIQKPKEHAASCLVGLLSEPKASPKKESKKEISNVDINQTPPAEPKIIAEAANEKNPQAIPHKNNSTFNSNVILSEIIPDTNTPISAKEEKVTSPAKISLNSNFTPGNEYINLENPSVDMENFKRLLLLNRFIPFEILQNSIDSRQYFLLYVNRQFYYFPLNSQELFILIKSYSCKNKYRKLLCMNGNLLIYWMHKHDHHVNNICSLQFLYNMLLESKEHKLIHDPIHMIQIYEKLEPTDHAYTYPDIMPLYDQIYKSMTAESLYTDDQFIQQFEFEHRIYQYLLRQYVFKTRKGSHLFSISGDLHWTYNFSYSLDEPLHIKNCQVIRYTVKCKSGLPDTFIKECIYFLSFNSLNIHTLFFDTASFIIVIPESEYNQCSTSINELINIRAKALDIFPVSISEIIEYT